ncbi:MAG: hypothetical protein AAB473_00435 [Patescibacteria group bacterium]
MQQAQRSSPVFFIARAVVGYGVWFLTVPAIILQLFGVCLAFVAILGLALSWNPDLGNRLFAAIASALPNLHVSVQINLIQPFLVAYTVFCVVMSLIEPLIHWKFNIQWKWTAQKSLFALIGLATITYGSTALLALSLHKDPLVAFIFLVITAITSAVAVVANALGTKIIDLFR